MSEQTGFTEDRARTYDERIQRMIPGYALLHRLAGAILAEEISATASVLVAGAGTGMEIVEWGLTHSQWRFTGVDPAPTMLTIAKEKCEKNGLLSRVEFQSGTVDQLPRATKFDACTLLLVLHFLPDNGQKAQLLSSIASRLKPGGSFLLATLVGDPQSIPYKKMSELTKAWGIAQGMDPQEAEKYCDPARTDLHSVPEEQLKMLLHNAGFIDVRRFHQVFNIGAWMARTPG